MKGVDLMTGNWSWVKGGIILGILNIVVFLSGNHFGTTTFYAQTTGYTAGFFFPDWIPVSEWTKGTCGATDTLSVGWQWLLIMGLFIGAFFGRVTNKTNDNSRKDIPEMWIERFGDKPVKRYVHAFIGGFLLLIGARLAGGCTSSHLISGMSQMAISGIIFGLSVFAAAIPTALLLYRKGGAANE